MNPQVSGKVETLIDEAKWREIVERDRERRKGECQHESIALGSSAPWAIDQEIDAVCRACGERLVGIPGDEYEYSVDESGGSTATRRPHVAPAR